MAPPPPGSVAENDFLSILAQASNAYTAGDKTEFQQGVIYRHREMDIARLFGASYEVHNWKGKVYKLSSNGDGDGILEVTIQDDFVWLTTWNNALSDTFDNTLVKPTSPVYNQLANLREGDDVVFSGRMVVGSSGDAIKSTDMSMDSKMKEPEFLFVFTDVHKQ